MAFLNNKQVGIRLIEERTKTKLSARRYAMDAGVDQSQYSKIEKGELTITENILLKLISTYGLDRNYILYGKNVPHGTSETVKQDLNDSGDHNTYSLKAPPGEQKKAATLEDTMQAILNLTQSNLNISESNKSLARSNEELVAMLKGKEATVKTEQKTLTEMVAIVQVLHEYTMEIMAEAKDKPLKDVRKEFQQREKKAAALPDKSGIAAGEGS